MLKVEHLDVHYGDLQVLWDLSLDVRKGEIVALIGSNGAGKSTVLRAMTGLLPPSGGTITHNGNLLNHLKPHEIVAMGISMVPEGRRLFPKMTVLANLEMGAFPKKSRGAMHESLKWVYEIFPVLRQRSRQIAGSLSGGEQQMLAIGRGLMSMPRLLMLDEPSLGLAPVMADFIFEAIREIRQRMRFSILLVEQRAVEALESCDSAYILESGRITMNGNRETLLGNPMIQKTYLGEVN